MPFSGVSTNRNWAQGHKDALQKFLKVYTRSIAWLSDPANREEAVSLMMSVSKLSHDDVEKAYDFLIKSGFLEPTGAISKGKLDAVVDALKQLGDIPSDFKVDRLFMPDVTKIVD
jgi:ABC-type nitrate/sulfonate/bicarbonate transport system substrate-binding protein